MTFLLAEEKGMQLIFKTETFVNMSMANLVVNILFGEIIHHSAQEIRKILDRGLNGRGNSTFYSGP